MRDFPYFSFTGGHSILIGGILDVYQDPGRVIGRSMMGTFCTYDFLFVF